MKTPKTTTQIQTYFKGDRSLILTEHDGQLWVTDRFLLLPVDEKSLVAKLLAEFNLPLEPMVCDVGRTVYRRVNDVIPSVGSVFPEHVDALTPLKRETICGYDNIALTPPVSDPFTVWVNADDRRVILDARRVVMTELLTPGAEWFAGPDPVKAVARLRGGKVVGLLMPMRNNATGTLRKSQAA